MIKTIMTIEDPGRFAIVQNQTPQPIVVNYITQPSPEEQKKIVEKLVALLEKKDQE